MLHKTKRFMASILTFAMVASLGTVLAPVMTDSDTVVKAAFGDEGNEGLAAVDKLTVSSPNGKIRVQIWESAEGSYYYSAYLNNYVVIQCSPFGIDTELTNLKSGLDLDDASVSVVEGNYDYDLIQGPVNHVNKDYRELDFALTKGASRMTMNFRVDNEGIAYRYLLDLDTGDDNEKIAIKDEDSNFILPDSSTLWTNGWSATYEGGEYTERTMAQVKSANAMYSTPILACTGSDAADAWVLLSEASVYNNDDPYCASVFQTSGGKKNIKVRFGRDMRDEQAGEIYHKVTHPRDHDDLPSVDFTGSCQTPWRVAIIGETLDDVTGSTLIPDLNPPAEGDFSWVVPGTSVWSWWSTGDNIDFNCMRDYIDFCSEAGITYCLVDFGWENWSEYETKVEGLVDYADDRNVGILLWYGVHKWDAKHEFDLDNEKDINEQFEWCERIGVKGVKVDYIESDSQFAMKNMYWILKSAAEHHLVVNFHGVTDPNGENRTFPNLLSSEAVCGMEYFKWGNASPVETLVTLPFTRNVIGSMEYTPALFAISHDASSRQNYSPATNGFMLSMCINYESAVQTWAQSGYVYPGYKAFPLIADVPSTWDESILIEGYPKKNVIRARRNGENWYIGAMTVEENTYYVPLDFLDYGEEYYAYIYKDNEDASDIEVEKKVVTSNDILELELAANGGCAIKLSKNEPEKHTSYDDFTFYEAEKAMLSGNLSTTKEQIYISGKSYVQGLGGGEDNKITFDKVYVPEAGDYELKLYVLADRDRNLSVRVNGGEPRVYNDIVGVVNNGGAVGTYREEIIIPLNEGYNTIELYTESGGAPSVDRIAVGKPLITDATVTLEKQSYKYTGSACRPAVTVTRDGKTLTEGKEYELFYSNAVNVGTATVYVTGINGYGGQLKETYTIEASDVVNPPAGDGQTPSSDSTPSAAPVSSATPAPSATPGRSEATSSSAKEAAVGRVKLSSVKAARKSIRVTYKKVSGAAGYQINYADNKKFKKSRIVSVKAKTTSRVLKKLVSGRKYYIRVRAYKTVSGKKTFGKWSVIKGVKVK